VLALRSDEPSSLRARVLVGSARLAAFQADWNDALELLEEATAAARSLGDRATLALALGKSCWAEAEQGRQREGEELGEEGLAVARTVGDAWITAEVLNDLALATYRSNLPRTRALLEESLAIRRSLRDEPNIADSLNNLCYCALLVGEYDEADAYLAEGLEVARKIGDVRHLALLAGNFGLIHLLRADFARAREAFAECIGLCAGLGDKRSALEALAGLAAIAACEGDRAKAATIDGCVESIHQSAGAARSAGELMLVDRYFAAAREELGEDAWARAASEGAALSFDTCVALALPSV
jgi:tetratricopeptide (TPR) repeat protein